MREAVGVQLAPLRELLKGSRPPKKGTDGDPVVWLDRLAALFREVDFRSTTASTSHPCVPALGDAWPVLRDVMDKSVPSPNSTEPLVRFSAEEWIFLRRARISVGDFQRERGCVDYRVRRAKCSLPFSLIYIYFRKTTSEYPKYASPKIPQ